MEQQEGQIDDKELDAIFNEDDTAKTEDVVEATTEDKVEETEVKEDSTEIKADSSEEEAVVESEEPSPPSNYDALKKDFANLQHKYKSDEGRVSALQRQINELQKVNNTLKRTPQEETPVETKPTIDSKKIVDDLYSGDEEKARAAVEALVSQRPATNAVDIEQTVNKVVQPLVEAEKARARSTQEQALEDVHPDWREQVKSPEFSEWLNALPQTVQQLIHSDDASDAVYILDQFNRVETPEPTVDSEKTKVEKIQDKREKQLADGTGLPSKHSAGASSGMPSDPDALFDYLERNDPDLKPAYRR
jgi:hypothetical protein